MLVLATTIPVVSSVVALVSIGAVCFCKKRVPMPPQAASVVVHPRDSSEVLIQIAWQDRRDHQWQKQWHI
jgi:hypothetical protein